jgi:mannose/fructose/N-acetylgalactosamine-specific phosphotransferase system component IIB
VSFWLLAQIVLNLLFIASIGLLWVKLSRPAKDDPKLSKGLQLLQSKISILEDLSDRTEFQVSQLTALMERKCIEIQEKITQADRQIALIEQSSQKSLEVAQIFQDKIPHSEILERQNTVKYVNAARLAHQGMSVEEIAKQVDLSRAEIEFISKVNRDHLQFSLEALPAWAQSTVAPAPQGAATTSKVVPTEVPVQTDLLTKPSLPLQKFVEIDLRAPVPAKTQKRPEVKSFEFPRV